MSVVRAAFRLAAVAALRDRTWAGTRVFDTPNLPIDLAMVTENSPYVGVYTNKDHRNPMGKEIDGGEEGRTMELAVEFGVAHPLDGTEGGTGPSVSITTPTDESYELIVDNLERQILYALLLDAESPWGRVWNRFIIKFNDVESLPGRSAERGERWAARRLAFDVETFADPVAGQELRPSHPVQAFLAQAAIDSTAIRPIALQNIIAMTAVDPRPDWRVAQAQLGISTKATRGIGIAPAIIPDEITAPGLQTVDLPQKQPEDIGEIEDFIDGRED